MPTRRAAIVVLIGRTITNINARDRCRVDAREAERYRETLQRCSYAGPGSGFGYHPSFPVGEGLYQFFATSRPRGIRRGTTRVDYRLKRRLKLLIPDTLVFNVQDDLQWYYTDKDGYVARMAQFEPGQAVDVFGDVRFEDDLAAVRKQSCLFPLGDFNGDPDQPALCSSGNSISLVNTRDLRVITGVGGTDGAVPAPALDGGDAFLVQKFVKSKGPHAFIIRQTMERGLPPTAWMISNRQPYGEEISPLGSLLVAAPELVGRFVTTPAKDRACGITRLGPGACAESAEAARNIFQHLEAVLGQRLEVLVVDFTKDDRGRLWLLQVKAFRFLGCTPQKPFRLTARARRDALYWLRGETPPDISSRAKPGEIMAPMCSSNVAQEEDNNITAGGEEVRVTSGGTVHGDEPEDLFCCRKTPCGMCGAMLHREDLTFLMTKRMIRETLFHICSRLIPEQVPRSLRAATVAASAAAIVSTSRAAGGRDAIATSGGGASGASNPPTPCASVTYRDIFVCETCFTLHQIETSLARAERRLAAAIRAPVGKVEILRPATRAEGSPSRLRHSRDGRFSRSQRGEIHSAMERRSAGGMDGVMNGRRLGRDIDAFTPVDPLETPGDMTLCRLLVGITDILDVPRSFLEEAASRSSSLQLCYELLGTHEIVRLENPFKERNTDGSVGSDVVESTSLPLVIPVRSLRLFSFVAEATPLEGDLPTGSGLGSFLSCQREIILSISLVTGKRRTTNRSRMTNRSARAGTKHDSAPEERGVDGRSKSQSRFQTIRAWAGEARLGLEQFRNDRVRKVELQAPLLLCEAPDGDCASSTLVLVRAFLGLERVRPSAYVAMLPRPLLYHRGIYVVGTSDSIHADGLHTCDPLPEEWMDIIDRSAESSAITTTALKGQGWRRQRVECTPPASREPLERQPSTSEEEAMEAFNGSVWGLCLCIAGVRIPERPTLARAVPQEEQAYVGRPDSMGETRATGRSAVVDGIAAKKLKAAPIPVPKRWLVRCLIFGHAFYAKLPARSPPRRAALGKGHYGGEDIPSSLAGLEVHAYLQCGITDLRSLLSPDLKKGLEAAVFEVELLQHQLEGGVGAGTEIVRCRCEVPVGTLVDARYIEGTYPLFDGDDTKCAQECGESITPTLNSHHMALHSTGGGTFNASLELAVHLYRMGPMDCHKDSGVFGIEGGQMEGRARWEPPSLVEKGQIKLDHMDGVIRVFERPPFEP